MKTAFIRLAITLGAVLFTASATAAQITVEFQGFANGSKAGTVHGDGTSIGARAGQFEFSVDPDSGIYWNDTINAFCIDITTYLVTSGPTTFDVVAASDSTFLNATSLSLVGQLYDGHAHSLGNALEDAAFQLALWEIVYDHDTALDLGAGLFSSNAFDGAQSVAQGWLNGLSAGSNHVSSGYEFFVLEPFNPESNQALLVAREVPVPTPATLALLGAGLITIGALRRRRTR